MKKLFNTLRQKGRLDIQIDYHKLFNETATDVIDRKPDEYAGFDTAAMKEDNCIIRVEFMPLDKPMVALSYSNDIEQALKLVSKEYKKWRPKK